jgi:hypothetical protein
MPFLKASVQYGDFEGTVSADDAMPKGIREYLKENGLIAENEFLVSVEFYFLEHPGGNRTEVHLVILLLQDIHNFEEAQHAIRAAGGPIKLKEKNIDLSINEFIGLFKRFSVVLSPRNLDIIGIEYTTE